MDILYPIKRINQWDKDSFRPGPVGSVGEVITSVRLKQSAPDMAERFDPTFSGKNQPWSGSNVSDGSWTGWTSGGRSAVIVQRNFANNSNGNKTHVGWVMQNIVAPARTTEPKLTPLGRYGWDTTVGTVTRAKVSGEMFLPLPGAFGPTSLPRGSAKPTIISTSTGTGIVLPAADVLITDPVFGDTGTIDYIVEGCQKKDYSVDQDGEEPIWAPAMDDPRRKHPDDNDLYHYQWRKASTYGGEKVEVYKQYPEIGDRVWHYYLPTGKFEWRKFNPCASIGRPENEPGNNQGRGPVKIPRPGNQDKRRQDRKKEREEEKKKKQKMR